MTLASKKLYLSLCDAHTVRFFPRCHELLSPNWHNLVLCENLCALGFPFCAREIARSQFLANCKLVAKGMTCTKLHVTIQTKSFVVLLPRTKRMTERSKRDANWETNEKFCKFNPANATKNAIIDSCTTEHYQMSGFQECVYNSHSSIPSFARS